MMLSKEELRQKQYAFYELQSPPGRHEMHRQILMEGDAERPYIVCYNQGVFWKRGR